MPPLVSIVITTKNEEKNIANCLKSILEQTYLSCHCEPACRQAGSPELVEGDVAISKPLIEIIVVDNNSTDRTREIVDQMSLRGSLPRAKPRGSNLSISFFTHGPERSAQRNFGVKKAKGEYILYLDADMILSKDVVKDCIEKMHNNPDVIALYVSEIVMGDSFWCKVRRFERSFYDGTVIDCVRFISKKAFDAVKGFDESLTGPEDWDLDRKLRNIGQVGLIKTPIFHNETKFDLKKYLAKKSFYAKNFNTYINKWGKSDSDVKKQFGFWYRYIGVFIENGKWKKLFTHPLLSLGMYFLRYSIGLMFISALYKERGIKNYEKNISLVSIPDSNYLNGKIPLVSVIFPILKYKKELIEVINSVLNQSYKNLEFILVTPKLCPNIEHLANMHHLTIQICTGKSNCRNVGARIAKGEFLLHIDDDMILDPFIIEECISTVNRYGAKAVVIHEKEAKDQGIINKTRVLEKRIVSNDYIIESPRFIEKKLFEDIGGFNELLDPIDDGDLKAKLEERKINIYSIKSEIHIIAHNRNTNLFDRFRHLFVRGKKAYLFNTLHPYSKQLKPIHRLKPYLIYREYLTENIGIGIILIILKTIDLIFLQLGTLFTSKRDKKIIAQIKNKRLYESTAGTYQKEFYENTLGARYVNNKEKEIVFNFLENIDPKERLKILDIGAGGGRWSKLLLERFPNAQVTACDLSKKMTKNLIFNFASYKNRFKVVNADMQNLPFKNEEFSLILSIRAIKYASNQTKVFNEINRVLKPSGIAIIELPYYNFVYKIIKHIKIFGILSDYANRIDLKDRNEIDKNLKKKGFKIKRLETCFAVPSTLYKRINSKVILNIINVINSVLPKKYFGRSLFYYLTKV